MITKRVLMTNMEYYKELFENAFEPILLIEGQNFVDGNKAALNILEMNSKADLKVVHPGQLSPQYQPDGELSEKKANKMISICYKQGSHQFEWVHKTLNNKEFLVEVTLKVVTIHGEQLLHTTWRELEKEKEYYKQTQLLEEKNRLINEVKQLINTNDENQLFDTLNLFDEYKRALDESSIVSKANIEGKITFVNDKFCEISGYSREELIGSNHSIVKHPDMPSEIFQNLWNTIRSKRVFKGVIKNISKTKKVYYVDSTIIPILDKEDNIVEYISVRHDITKIYEQEKVIKEQYTDNLTGLPNRVRLLKDITNAIDPKLAIINLDRFKDINESYSMEIGDKILLKVANDLKSIETTNIQAYRIAGDVFSLLVTGNVTLEMLRKICKNFTNTLDSEKFNIDDLELEVFTTIGIASGHDKLLTHAEIAHLYAKRRNRTIAVFDENLPIYKELKQSIQTTKNIKNAIKNDTILLYGQKIVSNDSEDVKYESLMRISLENGEVLSPFVFLEQAKKAKLYPQLSRKIMEKSCHYFKSTQTSFSINLMIDDIKNEKTLDFLFDTLQETKTQSFVTLEIVESEGIETYKEVEEFIIKAKKLGCKIAIDDFGTGYSNFEYLIKLDVDILKIDGSLIKNIHIDNNTYLTVKTIVSFAKVLKIKVVAEFVHCQEVQDIIEELGIDYSQGYLFHQPEELRLNEK